MSGVAQMDVVANDCRKLALECAAKAREAADISLAADPDASLAAKNWSAAALSATQAWMTIERNPRR